MEKEAGRWMNDGGNEKGFAVLVAGERSEMGDPWRNAPVHSVRLKSEGSDPLELFGNLNQETQVLSAFQMQAVQWLVRDSLHTLAKPIPKRSD